MLMAAHVGRQVKRLSAFALATLVMLPGCSGLPSLDGRSVSTMLQDTAGTALGRAITPRVDAHPGKAGIHPLANARDAFTARVLLARAAERSLDVQYYIWRGDLTGTLLFDALRAAAERGVRVRLLLDDNNTKGLDATLAALDAQPGIEVRLFNPFALRQLRALGYLTDFSRLNRRMHNKSFTADNQATIIGGRNVGDEYFGATDGVLFADLDVLAVGPVVADVSSQFDRYWASGSSYPVARLLEPPEPATREALRADAARVESEPAATAYLTAIRTSPFVDSLLRGELDLEWAPARLLVDDPAKGLGKADDSELLFSQLRITIDAAAHEMDIVSPYFVPTDAGVDALVQMAGRGVRIRVLTNSLEATDVIAVHAGYAKHRKALLEAGIVLFETRRLAGTASAGRAGPMGSSASSLHAKTFAVDRRRIFIGSFNFDPRSARLNTELGMIINSAPLATAMATAFDAKVPMNAYRVRLTADGALEWVEQQGEQTVIHATEPGTSVWQRVLVRVLSVLPIDWML